MKEFKTTINDVTRCIKILQNEKRCGVVRNLILVISVVYQVLMFLLAEVTNNVCFLDTVVSVPVITVILTSFDKFIYNVKLKKSEMNLSLLLNDLEKSGINTCVRELKKSVVVNRKEINVFHFKKEEQYVKSVNITSDQYILFLDNSSFVKGLLKRDVTEVCDNTSEDRKRSYYILDDRETEDVFDELKQVEVKKLIRKR